MKLAFDLNRLPGPAIAGLGLISTANTAPDTLTFVLSLAVTASGTLLTLDDVREDSLRRDARIVAHLAKVPGARTRQIGRALELRDRPVGRSLTRLVKDGLVVLETENETLPMRSYRLSD
ncbi:hypothetical protein ACFV0C_00360 [Streptomyces sp. NPDC059568]|uniref:hypothetical protein n=1 Tax=Streptomyces sp. NPDC059568 TaxID=3346868 RepID=UPI0036B375BF